MILGDVRIRVRNALDDNRGGSNPKWADSECDSAMRGAQAEIASMLVSNGSLLFRVNAALSSDATGNVDISALPIIGSPVQVASTTVPGYRYPLATAPIAGFRAARTGIEALLVTYNGVPTFPANDAASFVWGTSTNNPTLDSLLVFKAASELKVKEGSSEQNALIDQRVQDLTLTALQAVPARWTPLSTWTPTTAPQTFGYTFGDNGTSLQLVSLW
jgi:hypothetical protein